MATGKKYNENYIAIITIVIGVVLGLLIKKATIGIILGLVIGLLLSGVVVKLFRK